MNPLALAVIASVWIVILSFRQTRTARTVAFLASLTAVALVTYLANGPALLFIRIGLVVVAALVIVFFPWPIWYMSRADQEYDEFIANAAAHLHKMDGADFTSPGIREIRLRDLTDVGQRLEARAPPDVIWEQVRDRFLEHLRVDIDLLEDGSGRASGTFEQAASWLDMRIAWSRARDARSSFWR